MIQGDAIKRHTVPMPNGNAFLIIFTCGKQKRAVGMANERERVQWRHRHSSEPMPSLCRPLLHLYCFGSRYGPGVPDGMAIDEGGKLWVWPMERRVCSGGTDTAVSTCRLLPVHCAGFLAWRRRTGRDGHRRGRQAVGGHWGEREWAMVAQMQQPAHAFPMLASLYLVLLWLNVVPQAYRTGWRLMRAASCGW